MVCSDPVVLLEVQMHPDPGFHHRLAAQTYRFLQRHPQLEHLEVVVITPHQRHKLGPAQLPRPLAQPAHAANPPRKRAGRQQSADPG